MTGCYLNLGATTIEYDLIRSRRKSLSITVRTDGQVIVRAPLGASQADVERVLRKKGGWIVKKQQFFADHPPPLPPPAYVSGETHYYLGRPYALRVVEAQRQGVFLDGARLVLRVRDAGDLARKRKVMVEWYRARAQQVFAARLDACYPAAAKLGIPFPELRIRLMKRRWGSCSADGTVTLNLRLVQTPQACIDSVIFHELAHLKEHNHSRAFYAVLAQMQPDWRTRRDELNRFQVA